MKQMAYAAALVEQRVAREHAISNEQPLEVLLHLFAPRVERSGFLRPADVAPGPRQAGQRLRVECHRPGAAKTVAQRGVCGLERVVPVAMAVSGQRRAGDDALLHQTKRAFGVLPDGG